MLRVRSRPASSRPCAAPKYARSADIALILLIENLIGPFWVFLGFHEVPGKWTFIGGGCLLLTLSAHEIAMGLMGSERGKAAAATSSNSSLQGGAAFTAAADIGAQLPTQEPMWARNQGEDAPAKCAGHDATKGNVPTRYDPQRSNDY